MREDSIGIIIFTAVKMAEKVYHDVCGGETAHASNSWSSLCKTQMEWAVRTQCQGALQSVPAWLVVSSSQGVAQLIFFAF